MKKFVVLTVLSAITLSTPVFANTVDKATGEIMLPAREVAEELGYNVSWNQNDMSITFKKGDDVFKASVGSKEYFSNSKKALDASATVVIDGYSYIPTSFVDFMREAQKEDKKVVDTSTTLSQTPAEKYGTATVIGTVVTPADNSTSKVVDWHTEPTADVSAYNAKEDFGVVYKKTLITDGESKGKTLELKMNVQYHGDVTEDSPCIIFVPGGGFQASDIDKSRVTERKYLANNGFAVVTVEYRVIGQGLYNDGVQDINDAIRYVRANADKYNIDPDRIGLFGNSAGGYMVSLVATSQGVKELQGDNNLGYSSEVDAVINHYGLSDLTNVAMDYPEDIQKAHHTSKSAESQYVNGVYSNKGIVDDLVAAEKANPITYIDGTEPPFLIMHGTADGLVSPNQTVLLHNALLDEGVNSTRYSLTDSTHGSKGFDSEKTLSTMVDFFNKYLVK